MINCCTHKCDNEARYLVHWPGVGEARPMCLVCAARAAGIAAAMGFDLEAPEAIKREGDAHG